MILYTILVISLALIELINILLYLLRVIGRNLP